MESHTEFVSMGINAEFVSVMRWVGECVCLVFCIAPQGALPPVMMLYLGLLNKWMLHPCLSGG